MMPKITILALAALTLIGLQGGALSFADGTGDGGDGIDPGDQFECRRHSGEFAPFVETYHAGSSYEYWILEEVATPQSLANPNYVYDLRIGWRFTSEHDWKSVTARAWANFAGNPHGGHGSSASAEAIGDGTGYNYDTGPCGGLVLRTGANYDESVPVYYDIHYSGGNIEYGQMDESAVSVEAWTETSHTWGAEVSWEPGEWGASGSYDYTRSYGSSRTIQVSNGYSMTWSSTNHYIHPQSDYIQTGGGDLQTILNNWLGGL